MSRFKTLNSVGRLVQKTHALAAKEGKRVIITVGDVGDLFHVHGVNATPRRLLNKVDKLPTPKTTYPKVLKTSSGQFVIGCRPSPDQSPLWWTGSSITSAGLQPRVKRYATQARAAKDLPQAKALVKRSLTATY